MIVLNSILFCSPFTTNPWIGFFVAHNRIHFLQLHMWPIVPPLSPLSILLTFTASYLPPGSLWIPLISLPQRLFYWMSIWLAPLPSSDLCLKVTFILDRHNWKSLLLMLISFYSVLLYILPVYFLNCLLLLCNTNFTRTELLVCVGHSVVSLLQ